MATLILGQPSKIDANITLTQTGTDQSASILLHYPNGASAQLLSTLGFNTPIEAMIIGTKGRIKIQNPWFKATDFSVILNNGHIDNYSIPHQSNGLEHEIRHVQDCLDKGLLQSPDMPHDLTLQISKIMDAILAKA